jgi:hypothetical protein
MSEQSQPMQLLEEFVKAVSRAMAVIDQFEPSRSGNITFERLEEAMMWAQVMAHNVTLKPPRQGEVTDQPRLIVPENAFKNVIG